jgi:hypothetical protein
VGELRLLGFPNLVGFGERTCYSDEAQQNARAFLLASDFENMSGLKMLSVFSAIKAAWSDDDGLVRKNVRLTSKTPQQLYPDVAAALGNESSWPTRTPEAELDAAVADAADDELDDEDLEDELEDDDELTDDELEAEDAAQGDQYGLAGRLILKETRVKPGDAVCAFGIYSGDKRGLTPGGLGADHFIKLIRGKPEVIEAEARGRVWKNIVGGILALIVVHAGAYALLLAAPK